MKSPLIPASRFLAALLLAAAALPPAAIGQSAPAPVAAEDPANNAVAEKRASGIMDTLKLSDAKQAARVKQHIVNFVISIKNIHEGKNAPAGEAKDAALAKARTELYAGLNAEKLTPEQQVVVKNGLSANHYKINYDAFVDLVPTLTAEEKTYIAEQLTTAFDAAVILNEGTAKGEVFHKVRGKINIYLSKRGYDLKKLSIERNERNKAKADKEKK